MQDPARLLLSQIIAAALFPAGEEDRALSLYDSIEPCPQPELGQYAFKSFAAAKAAGRNPKDAAEAVTAALAHDPRIRAVKQAGPYVNIVLQPAESAALLTATLKDGTAVAPLSPSLRHRYLIEHSQPNTHKELHIGHTRNSVLGDTLCRLLRHGGHHVHAENYHGDEGAHVAKCIWYMKKTAQTPPSGADRGTWLGAIYVAATAAESAAEGDEAAVIKNEISAVLKEIEERSGPAYETWEETRAWSLELFHKFYDWLGVSFDGERCESDVSAESFQVVQDYLEKGIFIRSEGAIGADLSDRKLGFCLLLKSDGRSLYATKDLALALLRFRTEKPDTCVYVVDNRQSHHFRQVFATLDKMGFREAERCFHLAYEMVETKDGAMSSRKGNIVPILSLIAELQDRARATVAQRYEQEWSAEQIEETAAAIARAAVRYGMLKVDPESKIVFDMDSWLTMEGNTGPYLQYVYARMASLQRKSADPDCDLSAPIAWNRLEKTGEEQFLSHLCAFGDAVDSACRKLKPNLFANYTYEMARKFNIFYTESPINSEPDPDIRKARMALVKAGHACLGSALDLLGIPRIAQM